MRRLVRQTALEPRNLVLPLFVAEDVTDKKPISSMPHVFQHSINSLCTITEQAIRAGLGAVMLFGVPSFDKKDPIGSEAISPEGILNQAIARLRSEFGDDTVIMADTCLDEFTSHGHCGVINSNGKVLNDDTVELYTAMALAQAQAGVHCVAPSGMMDGQVGAIRSTLDAQGYTDTTILAYTAKYASSLYGPFREAVGSSLSPTLNTSYRDPSHIGDTNAEDTTIMPMYRDRKSYQQDPGNARESCLEYSLDIAEGADIVMVKPASLYLDIIREIALISHVPVAAYQVSGEYSMICAAGEKGWIDAQALSLESVLSIKRAGADIILTYFALDIAKHLEK